MNLCDMDITQAVLDDLTAQAKASPRLRMNLDLRNSPEDQSQRMLNAIEPEAWSRYIVIGVLLKRWCACADV